MLYVDSCILQRTFACILVILYDYTYIYTYIYVVYMLYGVCLLLSYIHTYVQIYTYIYMYIYRYIHMYIHIYSDAPQALVRVKAIYVLIYIICKCMHILCVYIIHAVR